MSRFLRAVAAGFAALLSILPFALPAQAAGWNDPFPYDAPAGMTLVDGQPRNGLALRARYRINPMFMRQVVGYRTAEAVGTIVVDTEHHFLYLVLPRNKALRYGIGVAREGFEWNGTHHITNKREWPGWTPPEEMKRRKPGLPDYMPGGPDNPLGARALYIGSTLYRIHGTNEPWTIGGNVSSGCIRMTNDDVMDLYERVRVGAKVIVM